MNDHVAIVGVGIFNFGRHPTMTGREQGAEAVKSALADAGVLWTDIQFAAGGSQDSGNADALLTDLGLTGIPFINVANGCATGGSAIKVVSQALLSGQADLGLAVGFDKHPKGAFNPLPENWGLEPWYGQAGLMSTTQFFAMKTQRYLYQHGLGERDLAKISERAFRNGSINPDAWRRTPFTAEEVLSSAPVSTPLTKYMFCNPSEGGAALILCRADDAWKYSQKPILVKALSLKSRRHGSFEVFAPGLPSISSDSATVQASKEAFKIAGISPSEIGVAQIQDTDAGSELIHMAECGFCQNGEQRELLSSGATDIDGKLPINTDGGCLANGEPVGASGIRQIIEVVKQLRGEAGERQVKGSINYGFTHVYGAPGVSAVSILELMRR